MFMRTRPYLYLTGCLLAMLTGSCSTGEEPADNGRTDKAYTIALAVNGTAALTSRTTVTEPDENNRGKQHVTRVQLYIYEQDAANNDFTCVASEDVKWAHLTGAQNGLETREQGYTTQFKNYKDNTEYKFLAMGFDDTYTGTADNPTYDNANSVAAYGQPDAIASVGDKLSNGHFALQNNADVKLIAASELFAGARTFTKADLEDGTARKEPIDLYRRVAGVMGWFKGLPETIDGKTVNKVVLRLYDKQNTQVAFLPILPNGYTDPAKVPNAEYVDYITSPGTEAESNILTSYTVDTKDNGSFSLSGYVLPAAASIQTGQSTLELAMLDADGNELAKRRVLYKSTDDKTTTRSGTGIIDDPVDTGDSPYYHYPLRANNFYRMGTKEAPIDLSGSTTTIYIEIDPVWDEYYGGAMDNQNIPSNGTIGIDKEWGEHEGGKLDNENQ